MSLLTLESTPSAATVAGKTFTPPPESKFKTKGVKRPAFMCPKRRGQTLSKAIKSINREAPKIPPGVQQESQASHVDRAVDSEFKSTVTKGILSLCDRYLSPGVSTATEAGFRTSPALQTLLERNLSWFSASNDFVKIAALVGSKTMLT